MKSKITAGLSAIALAACASNGGGTSTVGSLFSVVPDLLQSSFDSWKSSGQTASSQFAFTNSDTFDGKLYASLDGNTLDSNGRLKDVFVEFEPGIDAMPKRNVKWLSVVAAAHGELRKCDTHDPEYESIANFLFKLLDFTKDALRVREVIRYKAIIEYDSSEGEIGGIRYYDAKIPSAVKEAQMDYKGGCESITVQDLMSTIAANSSGDGA